MEYVLALLVLVVVVAAVLSVPLRRRGEEERREETRLAELRAAKEAKYREIRDAELDREMGKLSRDDWRRHAVNEFVRRQYEEVKKIKPHVKVGISPFGIWRPGHPAGIAGFDQYAKLYADAKLWLNEGWVDYFTPQLYWPIGQEKQSFPRLLGWWAKENTRGRHVWTALPAPS